MVYDRVSITFRDTTLSFKLWKRLKNIRALKRNRPTMRAKLNWQYDVRYAAAQVIHWSLDSCWKATSYSILLENATVELWVAASLMALCRQWWCRYLRQLFELYSPAFIVFDKFYSLDSEWNVSYKTEIVLWRCVNTYTLLWLLSALRCFVVLFIRYCCVVAEIVG